MKAGKGVNNKYLARINKWHRNIDSFFAYIAIVLVVAMTLLGTVDVVGRYFFNRPIPGSYDLMQYSLGAVAFLAFAYVQLGRGHITVNLLTEQLRGGKALLLDLILLIIMLTATIIIGWYGGKSAVISWQAGDTSLGTIRLPLGPAKAVVPVGCALLGLRLISQIIESTNRLIRGSTE